MICDKEFGKAIDTLVFDGEIVIDRPKGSVHPRFPQIRYALDYGYIKNTASTDGGGIDVWCGSTGDRAVTALICTVDLWKRDSEIKLLLGCTEEEIESIYRFHNSTEYMKGLLIRRAL